MLGLLVWLVGSVGWECCLLVGVLFAAIGELLHLVICVAVVAPVWVLFGLRKVLTVSRLRRFGLLLRVIVVTCWIRACLQVHGC